MGVGEYMARIAHIISHPIIYNTPLYRLMAKHYEFEVWYDVDTSGGYFDAGFDRVVQWGDSLREGYRHRFLSTLDMLRRISRREVDAVWVHGYASPRHLAVIAAAKRAGAKVWIRGETHLGLGTSWYKPPILRKLFQAVDVCLYIGSMNRAFYEHHGVPKDKLVFMPYCVDNEWWMAGGMASPRELFVLYVGKLLPEKGIDRLLKVAAAMPDALFMIAGDGPVSVKGENIMKLGFQTPEQLRELYSRASLLIVPSKREPYGLVVNEALCCGCPVLASGAVASAMDFRVGCWMHTYKYDMALPWPSERKFVKKVNFNERETQSWVKAVNDMLAAKWDHKLIREQMYGWSYQQDLEGIREAVKRCCL